MADIESKVVPRNDPEAVTCWVDLPGDEVMVDVVRPPRDAAKVLLDLEARYPDRPVMAIFGVDLLYVPEDESHIIRGEN